MGNAKRNQALSQTQSGCGVPPPVSRKSKQIKSPPPFRNNLSPLRPPEIRKSNIIVEKSPELPPSFRSLSPRSIGNSFRQKSRSRVNECHPAFQMCSATMF